MTLSAPAPKWLRTWPLLACLLLGFALPSLGCKDKVKAGTTKGTAVTKRKVPTQPTRPKPPPCEEGKRSHLHCLAFCGGGRILGFAHCKKNRFTCQSGVREDKCD